ncbi:MAG: alcohol dehydrogenase [Actinobacteria bacterium]|uniref:Zn-dependent alcohol dehydrogenase n=1 Tax=Microbacterium sp. NPDC076895 TaxID=3154957 RepID=UPI001000CC3B|nr:MAG: alcohol dehydrogenase [Actinomycetota bacterium]
MQASVLTEFGQALTVEDVDIDEPRPNEVIVRVAASGLCHSDVTILQGNMLGRSYVPAVLGHEVAGVVERVGSAVTEFGPGDHVVGCNSRYCGKCPQCLDGLTYLCSNRSVIARDRPRLTLDGVEVAQAGQLGGFAELLLVGEDTLVKVPKELPLDRAALLSCAALTGYGSVVNGAQVKAGTKVAVFGCGGVGLNVIQAAALAGARQVVAIDISEEKLELARVFGATDLVDARRGETVAEVLALTGGVDYVFECIGLPSAIAEGIRILRPGRTAYAVGVPRTGVSLEVPGAEFIFGGKGLRGLFMGSNNFKRDIPILADLYLRGKFKLDELIGERIALDQLNEAVTRMEGGGIARSVVVF